MASQSQLQNQVFDGLYCEEEHFEDDLGVFGFEEESHDSDEKVTKPLTLFQHDLFWEDDELLVLFAKEQESHLSYRDLSSDGSLMIARKDAVEWILRVNAHYGFTAMTAVLAVNYFDRFISSRCFPRDKPWMSQISAVACLSLAAKVEETQVPLLLDLQVEESKFVFEAKTIQRMELFVLSTLQWKMNPVTPFSFIDYITRRLGVKTNLHWEFLLTCQRLLLSVISDSRFVSYLPSVIATATMLLVIRDIEPCNALEYQNQLLGILKISKEKVDKCSELMLKLLDTYTQKQYQIHKRKYQSLPGSPNGVIDAYFSCCDSSNDSWAVVPSVSSSPEPLFKKSRTRDQQMRLAPLNRVYGGP